MLLTNFQMPIPSWTKRRLAIALAILLHLAVFGIAKTLPLHLCNVGNSLSHKDTDCTPLTVGGLVKYNDSLTARLK